MATKVTNGTPMQFDRCWEISDVQMDIGHASIANPNVTANTLVQLSRHVLQGGLPGNLTYSVLPGVGIDILSDQLTENSILTYSLSERST
jgi:hypothetical protein